MDTLITAFAGIIGGAGALLASFNAIKTRKVTEQANLIQTYSDLVASLQSEVARLNTQVAALIAENAAQRVRIAELESRQLALERKSNHE